MRRSIAASSSYASDRLRPTSSRSTASSLLYVLPLLTWGATVTSAVLLVVLWHTDELRGYVGAAHAGWFLAASYCQFLGTTTLVTTLGLIFQTILAIVLILRWRLA